MHVAKVSMVNIEVELCRVNAACVAGTGVGAPSDFSRRKRHAGSGLYTSLVAEVRDMMHGM